MFKVWRGWGKMTPDLPWFGQWGLRSLSLFLFIIGHHSIEWGGPCIGYIGNRERGKQVTRPNLNELGPNI